MKRGDSSSRNGDTAAPSRWLWLAAAVLAGAVATARADDIQPDRPGFGESASVVERGRVQLETGLAWTRVGDGASVLDLPQGVLRVGVGASLEVRVQAFDWLRPNGGGTSGWSDAGVGVRWQAVAGAHEVSLRGVVYLQIGRASCRERVFRVV